MKSIKDMDRMIEMLKDKMNEEKEKYKKFFIEENSKVIEIEYPYNEKFDNKSSITLKVKQTGRQDLYLNYYKGAILQFNLIKKKYFGLVKEKENIILKFRELPKNKNLWMGWQLRMSCCENCNDFNHNFTEYKDYDVTDIEIIEIFPYDKPKKIIKLLPIVKATILESDLEEIENRYNEIIKKVKKEYLPDYVLEVLK